MTDSDRPSQETKSVRVILAVTSHLTANGLLIPQLEALTGLGWDVGIICSPGPLDVGVINGSSFIDLVPMSRSINPLADLAALRSLRKVLTQRKPDVVVASTPKAGLLVMITSFGCRVPIRVLQLRGARWDGLKGLTGLLLRRADWIAIRCATDVISVSPSLSTLFVEHKVSKSLPRVLGPGGSKGVDRDVFQPATDYSYDSEQPRLGFAGRLSVDKGLLTLLSTFRVIKKSIPQATLEIIGDLDTSDPISRDLHQALSTEAGLSLRGSIHRAELAETMREWDLLLFPSVREGLPNVVIEAAASGIPTIAWDVTGVKDAVRNGDSGMLVALANDSDYSNSVLLALQGEMHKKLREGALVLAERFDSQEIQLRFSTFLQALITNRSQKQDN